MNWLKNRHPGPELMDAPDVDHEQFKGVLKELAVINTWLGGYEPTITGIKQLANDRLGKLTIVDIGCGGGDTLVKLAKYAAKKGYYWELVGIDLHSAAVSYAQANCSKYPSIRIIQANFEDIEKHVPEPDIIINALFMHHLTESEVLKCMQIMQCAKTGWLINDLHRHWLAYYSIWALTTLFSKSKLVRYDARISVWRGWKKSDWIRLQKKANQTISIRWHWAFRWLVIGYPKQLA